MSQYIMMLRQFSVNASLYLVISGVLVSGMQAVVKGIHESTTISQGLPTTEWMLATADPDSESSPVMDDRGSGR